MRLSIFSVGRLKAVPERDLFDHYWARASKIAPAIGIKIEKVREFPESRSKNAAERRSEESAALIGALPNSAYCIALDQSGKELTSRQLAAAIRTRMDRGTSETVFAIGGPDGHDPSAIARLPMRLSLGRMTWPHRMVRFMAAEQVYRALAIMAGHPYHRD